MIERFQKQTRGAKAPPSGHDPADFSHSPPRGSACANCGHAGHEHERIRVNRDRGPAGATSYILACPGQEEV